MIHYEEALDQVYAPLPLPVPLPSAACQRSTAIYAVEIWDRQGSRSGVTVHDEEEEEEEEIYCA